MMKSNADQPKAPKSKPGAKPDAKVKVTKSAPQVILALSAKDIPEI